MSKEDGELIKRKMKYAGLNHYQVQEKMKIRPVLMQMFLKGEVLQRKFIDELKEIVIESLIKKYGRVKKKKK